MGGQISINGQSKIAQPMDYMSIKVHLSGQCYPSSHNVLKVVNGASQEILTILKSVMDTSPNSQDRVIATPGLTSREDKVVYDNRTRSNRILCKNGWHANNTVVLEVAKSSVWSEIQQEVLQVVDRFDASSDDSQGSIKILLSKPTANLRTATRKALLAKVAQEALVDASLRFKRIQMQCSLISPQIINIENLTANPYPRRSARAPEMDSSSPTLPEFQPQFDKIQVTANARITWKFQSMAYHDCTNVEEQERG